MKQKRRQILIATAALATGTAGPALRAQGNAIRLWVGATPGGSTDTIARDLAPELGRLLGRTVIVENKAGAGGNLAADTVAKSPPDGNNLLVSYTSHTINATLYKKLPFDPIRDFTPLTQLVTSSSLLVAHPSVPVADVKELVAYARANPGKLSFAIGGIGSSLHLAGEAFKLQAKVFIVNIPYRGTGPAVADVVAGNVPLMFAPVVNTRAFIQAGRLKALGVTSPRRLPQFPDVPAIAEVLPGFESSAWFGLFGPAKMAPDLVQRISDAARSAMKSEGIRKHLEQDAAEAVASSPEDFARFVKADVARWAPLIQRSGATPDS
jgi:tripartite-type tricarboxylate transporter receptor subunit TctC